MATTAEARAFIEKVAPVIVKYAKKYGFKVASPIIAQACLESGYGASALAKVDANGVGYNMFGMKAGSSWTGKIRRMQTQEQKADGSYITIYSNFRAYSSLDEGIDGYFKFITGYSRYKKALTADTPRAYLQAIKDAGYATSLKYVDNNMRVVDTWNLTQYDAELNAPADGVATPTIKASYAGGNVKLLQQNINECTGWNIPLSGKVDKLTESAIFVWQHLNGLDADGIYGKKSYAKMEELINDRH